MLVYVNGYLGGAEGTEGERIRGFSLPEKYVLQGGEAIFRLCRAGTAAELPFAPQGRQTGRKCIPHRLGKRSEVLSAEARQAFFGGVEAFSARGLVCIASLQA